MSEYRYDFMDEKKILIPGASPTYWRVKERGRVKDKNDENYPGWKLYFVIEPINKLGKPIGQPVVLYAEKTLRKRIHKLFGLMPGDCVEFNIISEEDSRGVLRNTLHVKGILGTVAPEWVTSKFLDELINTPGLEDEWIKKHSKNKELTIETATKKMKECIQIAKTIEVEMKIKLDISVIAVALYNSLLNTENDNSLDSDNTDTDIDIDTDIDTDTNIDTENNNIENNKKSSETVKSNKTKYIPNDNDEKRLLNMSLDGFKDAVDRNSTKIMSHLYYMSNANKDIVQELKLLKNVIDNNAKKKALIRIWNQVKNLINGIDTENDLPF